jgi:hypothetical protein
MRRRLRTWIIAKPLRSTALFFLVGILLSNIVLFVADSESFLLEPVRTIALAIPGGLIISILFYRQIIRSSRDQE